MPDTTQNVNASITYLDDWTTRLAQYPVQPVTISSATGAASDGAVVSAVDGTATGITFHLATASVPTPKNVLVTLTATLSNGDVDVRELTVGVSA